MLARLGTFALALSAAACASTGAVPRPFPTPGGAPSAVRRPAPADAGYAVAGSALALRGVPYRNGGADPTGFDCSGFTQYVFAEHGITLPRAVQEQFKVGRSIESRDVVAGDLIFFSTTGPGPTHVGISVGGDQFVHAPSSTGVVRVEHVSSPYWSRRFIGARRIQ